MPDHVHMCIEIPRSMQCRLLVFSARSAMIARQFSGKQRNKWELGREDAVSTVGFELEAVRHHIREQEIADKGGQF